MNRVSGSSRWFERDGRQVAGAAHDHQAGGAAGVASTLRSISIPASSEMGLMPSLTSDSKTPSFSPMPAPDQTDHSSATQRHCGLPCSINWAAAAWSYR